MKNLLKALYLFQQTVPAIKKDSDNPFHKSKYATLDQIQKTILPSLTECGLSIVQSNVTTESKMTVVTTVYHVESGESMSSEFPVIVMKPTSQEYGSAVTYAKRYSLSGLLNLIIQDEDDDGNASSQLQKSPELPDLTKDKYDLMASYIESGRYKEVESAMSKYKLTSEQKTSLLDMLNKYKTASIKSNIKK